MSEKDLESWFTEMLEWLEEARNKMPDEHDKAIINQVIGFCIGKKMKIRMINTQLIKNLESLNFLAEKRIKELESEHPKKAELEQEIEILKFRLNKFEKS